MKIFCDNKTAMDCIVKSWDRLLRYGSCLRWPGPFEAAIKRMWMDREARFSGVPI